MTYLQQAIEDAVKGGWKPRNTQNCLLGEVCGVEVLYDDDWIKNCQDRKVSIRIEEILLDSAFWIGLVRGRVPHLSIQEAKDIALYKNRALVQHLHEERGMEDFFEKISKEK